MKNETNKKNPYWISKHRYLELKHWCMQYSDWEEECQSYTYLTSKIPEGEKSSEVSDSTYQMTIRIGKLKRKMYLIADICKQVAPNYAITLMVAITNNFSYDDVVVYNPSLPSRSDWYKTRRKFFYILSQERD